MAKKKIVKSKVVKKKVAKKIVKSKNEMAKKNDTRKNNHIATIEYDGNKTEITKDYLSKNYFAPLPCTTNIHDKVQKASALRAIALQLLLRTTDAQEGAINDILSELATGAYQDRLTVYSLTLTKGSEGSTEALRNLQKIRQSADTHLLNIIKATRDIKRPPVNVVVKEAGQVNVAEQINQADKQVNFAKNQQSA